MTNIPIRRPHRLVIVGKNSTVWKRLQAHSEWNSRSLAVIGHSDLQTFSFAPTDVVWIFSYSRIEAENTLLLQQLKSQGAERCYYVSTATVNTTSRTLCYNYPRIKAAAEKKAAALLKAEIVRIGLVYDDELELPAGRSAATQLSTLLSFILMQAWGGRTEPHYMFQLVDRPFRSSAEQILFNLYGTMLEWSGKRPCLLRPLDAILRAVNIRWYGYLYLSNRMLINGFA